MIDIDKSTKGVGYRWTQIQFWNKPFPGYSALFIDLSPQNVRHVNQLWSITLCQPTGELSLSSFSSWEKSSRHSLSVTCPEELLLGMGSDRSQNTSNVLEEWEHTEQCSELLSWPENRSMRRGRELPEGCLHLIYFEDYSDGSRWLHCFPYLLFCCHLSPSVSSTWQRPLLKS